MKLAVLNWTNQPVGGAETYLKSVLPHLRHSCESLCFLSESTFSRACGTFVEDAIPRLYLPWPDRARMQAFLEEHGVELALCHGFSDSEWDRAINSLVPSVFFMHNFYGNCISGSRMLKRPYRRPCTYAFNSACLLRYFPLGCGGWNPLTMVRHFHVQQGRKAALKAYAAVVTHSHFMRDSVKRLLGSKAHVHMIPLPTAETGLETARQEPTASETIIKLGFIGRMELNKGGDLLIRCLRYAADRLHREIEVYFMGSGTLEADWKALASREFRGRPDIRCRFLGWCDSTRRDEILRTLHLLVLPSTWPEPFGLVGMEAARFGVPTVAFDVGGISDWLIHNFNGRLVPLKKKSARDLALAIVQCLTDPVGYHRLRSGAKEQFKKFSMEEHLDHLLTLLRTVMTASQRS